MKPIQICQAPRLLGKFIKDPNLLTLRQREVLTLVANGDPNKTICRVLGLSSGTVKAHLHAAYERLGVRNRTEAVVKMLKGEINGNA